MAAPKGNKFAVGANSGRPKIYNSPTKFKNECDGYFEYCLGKYRNKRTKIGMADDKPTYQVVRECLRPPEHPTLTGLALYLGFHCLETFREYEAREEFSSAAKRARLKITMGYEAKLVTGKPTGSIFALKNIDRRNWEDKTVVDYTDLPKNEIKVQIEGPQAIFATDENQVDLTGLPDGTSPELPSVLRQTEEPEEE